MVIVKSRVAAEAETETGAQAPAAAVEGDSEGPPPTFDMNQFLRNTLSSFVLPTVISDEARQRDGHDGSPPSKKKQTTLSSTKSTPSFSATVGCSACAYCGQREQLPGQLYCQQCTDLFSNLLDSPACDQDERSQGRDRSRGRHQERQRNSSLTATRGSSGNGGARWSPTTTTSPTMCHVAVQTCAEVNDGTSAVFFSALGPTEFGTADVEPAFRDTL